MDHVNQQVESMSKDDAKADGEAGGWENDVCWGPCCQTGQQQSHKKPDIPIKLIMTTACTGSTAIMAFVEGLHQAANLSFADCQQSREVFDDIEKQGMYTIHVKGKKETKLADVFGALVNHTSSFGLPLFVKEQSSYLLHDDTLRSLVKQNGKVALFVRSNLFDLALCNIRDGWSSLGNCTSCGSFRNRGDAQLDSDEKVTFHTEDLLSGLQAMTTEQEKRASFYVENFDQKWSAADESTQTEELNSRVLDDNSPVEGDSVAPHEFAFATSEWAVATDVVLSVVTAEDLFAFEYSQSGLSLSVSAWTKLMKQIGSEIPDNIIHNFLKSHAASRPAPKTHTAMIENIDGVKEVIKTCYNQYSAEWCNSLNGMLRF